ncbi:hypothetical protein ID854_09800 [Xenorhabdus sp. M]|uniref:Uncharacterized protein n=1 Tax=Xenorhabdus szentirmaii TaxID=290112 RepID=A0AAW3YRN0_9GAMM|nr:hypothetical protein [Xenorhabdus sp. M]MBD2800738.1 hypothetical protein [Xenorhabdus sp. M]
MPNKQVNSYPPVTIVNATNFTAKGDVRYASLFCKNDTYDIQSGKTWVGPDRGVCLLTEITAILETANGSVRAKSYESSGTAYSQFVLIQVDENTFEVTRRVNTEIIEEEPDPYSSFK